MNYIKSLQIQLEEKKSELSNVESELAFLLSYLRSEKFQGFENNYVNASEMAEKLQRVINVIRFPEMNELITY